MVWAAVVMKLTNKTLGNFVSRAEQVWEREGGCGDWTGLTESQDCGLAGPALYSYCYCEEAVVKLDSVSPRARESW